MQIVLDIPDDLAADALAVLGADDAKDAAERLLRTLGVNIVNRRMVAERDAQIASVSDALGIEMPTPTRAEARRAEIDARRGSRER